MSDSPMKNEGVARLRDITFNVLHRKTPVSEFCDEFERLYNFVINKNDFSAREGHVFQDLFDKVVWFSPYPEEREKIPSYLGEDEIVLAAEAALKALGAINSRR